MANILICDDSSFTRKMIKNILKSEGHNIIDTDNGDSLLEMVKNQKFDCILLDLLMPNKSGIEVLKELQSADNKCPVIIISADTQETSKEMCFSLGAAEFLNKPPKQSDLINALQSALK